LTTNGCAVLPRSFLYAPGNRADLLAKVGRCGADAIVIDLEDAVPAGAKAEARHAAAQFLQSLPTTAGPAAFVRINAGPAGLDDLAALPLGALAGIRLPKLEDAETVAAVDRVLQAAAAPHIVIHPIIESVRGLYGMEQFVQASRRIERYIFGAGDYVRDIGAEATPDRIATLHARARIVARSRLLGLKPPIAHVFSMIKDIAGLAEACRVDRAMGFFGRSCIHPSQVATVNAAFSYSADDIERARRAVEAYAGAARAGRGAIVLDDGTLIDEAGLKRAQRVLEVAAQQAGEAAHEQP